MSEMRKDILSGRWVIVDQATADEASRFPFQPFTQGAAPCPFCETQEASTPPEVFALRRPDSAANGPGWTVRVVPNLKPRLRVEGCLERRAQGFHDLMNGVGAHEIIVETPRHDRSLHDLEIPEIAEVIRAYVARINDLQQDERLRYVLIFKNHGEAAGAHSISHSISQLMALPVTPRTVKIKLAVSREYYAEKERCIYCDVVRQEVQDVRRLVAENQDFVVFTPFASRFPFEMSIFPKSHASDFTQIASAAVGSLAAILRDVLRRLDRALGGPPYNLTLQNRPRLRLKEGYWTTIDQDFHWHLEILPQIFPIAGFEWASGFFYNPVSPETAAQRLGEVA